MSEEDRSYIPYYYGMNWQAPSGGNREVFSSQGLGLLAGRAMRQGVVGGVDAGLWLERLAGVPLEPSRMMIDWEVRPSLIRLAIGCRRFFTTSRRALLSDYIFHAL